MERLKIVWKEMETRVHFSSTHFHRSLLPQQQPKVVVDSRKHHFYEEEQSQLAVQRRLWILRHQQTMVVYIICRFRNECLNQMQQNSERYLGKWIHLRYIYSTQQKIQISHLQLISDQFNTYTATYPLQVNIYLAFSAPGLLPRFDSLRRN